MEIYGFDKRTAERIKKFAAGGMESASYGRPHPTNAGVGAWQMEATTSISAASGSTVGSGTAKLLYLTSGSLSSWEPGSATVTTTVYNPHEIALASGARFLGVRTLDGVLWVASWSFVEYKPLVRFTLAAALATSDASKSATITNQYGPGVDNTTSAGGITVHNLLTSTGGVYVFEGASGAAGLAAWDSGTNYRILQMECP